MVNNGEGEKMTAKQAMLNLVDDASPEELIEIVAKIATRLLVTVRETHAQMIKDEEARLAFIAKQAEHEVLHGSKLLTNVIKDYGI
jgi:hypothetical protein